MEPTSDDELLTTPQAAAILKLTPETLVQWRFHKRQPALKYIKVGGCIRYRLSDVNKYIASRKGN